MVDFPRVRRAFYRVVEVLFRTWGVRANRMTIDPCVDADAHQAKAWRQFAHALCRGPFNVCFARAAETELTDAQLIAISIHEAGHVIAEELELPAHAASRDDDSEKTPEPVQAEADDIIFRITGLRIVYNGRTCQEVDVAAFEALERRVVWR